MHDNHPQLTNSVWKKYKYVHFTLFALSWKRDTTYFKVPITPQLFFCSVESLCHAEQNGEKKICFWSKVEFSMNFQIAEKSRFENPLPRRRIRLKGMGRVWFVT